MNERQRDILMQAISLLREGMGSTGTGTLHYHKMRDAIELLAPLTKPAMFPGGTVLKDSYRTAKNGKLMCQCGHENVRHWYLKWDRATDETFTVSWDCRDCSCLRFQRERGY